VDRVTLIFVTVASLVCSSGMAEEKTRANIDKLGEQGPSVQMISPIFSQLVMLSFPKGFKTVSEQANSDHYIREAVLDGETVHRWSQMITVAGTKGIATNPNVTSRSFVERVAGGFKRACPDTFAATGLGATKISGQDAFVALASCGSVQSGADKRSETALLIAIQGTADLYSIQWAERESASSQPMTLDQAKWTDRFTKLSPIKLCPRVPGEAAPYPSCINQK
jgi:hypothetical protein